MLYVYLLKQRHQEGAKIILTLYVQKICLDFVKIE